VAEPRLLLHGAGLGAGLPGRPAGRGRNRSEKVASGVQADARALPEAT
jgi:hypothetical protein